MHMNVGVSSEKEKVKESQSRSVTPPLDIHFGCRVGGVTLFLFRTYTYNILILYLLRSYTHGRLILIPISRRTHTYSKSLYIYLYIYLERGTYHVLILLSIIYWFRAPIGVTELILIQRYLYTYWYLYLSQISCRSLQNLCLYKGTYTRTDTYLHLRSPVGVSRDITERILVLRNLFLYGSTRKYYLFKCPKRRTLVLISNLSYTHTGVPVSTIEFILIRSLYEDTRRYNRD